MFKLTILRTWRLEHFAIGTPGAQKHRILYYYTLNPGITDGAATPHNVSPQSSAMLTPDAQRQCNGADAAAIDAGTAGFEEFEVVQTFGETNANFAARLLVDHAAREAWWVTARRAEFARAGTGVS